MLRESPTICATLTGGATTVVGTVPLGEGGEPIVVPVAITTFTPQQTFTPRKYKNDNNENTKKWW